MSKRFMIIGLIVAIGGTTGACSVGPSTANSAEPVASAAASDGVVPPTTRPATHTATPTPKVPPKATPTPKPTPVPWAIFKSKAYHFSIKHPPTWRVTPGTATRADRIDDSASHYVYFEGESGTMSVNVQASTDAQKAFIQSHYDAKLVSEKRVRVGALTGRLLVFNGSDKGRTFRIQHILIASGKDGWQITMLSNSGAEKSDAKLFLRMYGSFKPTS